MKKTIFSLAILLAASTGFSAIAQNATPAPSKETKANKAEKRNFPNPFEGLNLTEQQKTQLQALAPAKPTQEQKEQMKAKKQEAAKAKMEKRAQAKRDYLAKVKAILTPEQYTQFLENNFVNQSMKAARKDGRHGSKGKFDKKRNNKGLTDKKGKAPRNGRPANSTAKA